MHCQKKKLLKSRLALLDAHQQSFTTWKDYPVQQQVRQAIDRALIEAPSGEVVLGEIDNDGRIYGLFGPLPYVHNIPETEFVPRYRFGLQIVLLNGLVLIKKDFRGNWNHFANESHNLLKLQTRANVPQIYRADPHRCILYKGLIPGHTVRDLLVQAGADILTVNVEKDNSLEDLSQDERIYEVWARGRKRLGLALPEAFLPQLEHELDRIHACGVARLSLTFGNIMMDARDGRPWLIDLEGSIDYGPWPGVLFDHERDRDRQKYNQIYGRALLTEHQARQALKTSLADQYAPVDFGRGLATYGFWNTDNGTGRWDYLNCRVVAPLVTGKHVLDLGANNGVMDLMMLKAGAASVIALEYSPDYVEMARMVHRIFEWRDIRQYAFNIQQKDMRAFLTESFGNFDVVTAFCSLYYLEPAEMAAIVRKAAQLAPVLILQAKTHARPEAGEKAVKSTPKYLAELMKNNGFPNVEWFAPPGFTRPILVGRRQ